MGPSNPQTLRKNGTPTSAISAMKIGISAMDAAIRGNSAMTVGVIDAPTATPRMVRAATDT